jgi:2-keto-4-pentenoate hydratase/2-oxohepta-3-ene-1,7-dioic acid hydratase in catechol pathway
MKVCLFSTSNAALAWGIIGPDADTVQTILAPFEDWAPAAASGSALKYPLGPIRKIGEVVLHAPVHQRGRIFGLGMNYITHLTRLGHKEPPPHPVAFLKVDSAIVDPDGEIAYPPTTKKLDYEIELVAVIARPLGATDEATSCLLGYTIGNDISARDAGKQLGGRDLFGQKTMDRTAPVGPWITTLDEFGLEQPQLDMRLRVNGEERQHDNTRNMVFSMAELLNFIDIRVALRAGDILFTGTTFGVGLEDGRLLQPGDVVENEIERIGVLRNTVGPKRQPSAKRLEGRLGIPP